MRTGVATGRPAAVAALVIAVSSCSLLPATPLGTVPADFEVMLERGPCFGSCPVYNLTVTADGAVVYDGVRFVAVEGPQTASLTPDEVHQIAQAVVDADFFDLADEYTVPATDLPSITLTVTMDTRTKQVYHYGVGCGAELDTAPAGLCDLEAALEGIPVENGWVAAR